MAQSGATVDGNTPEPVASARQRRSDEAEIQPLRRRWAPESLHLEYEVIINK